MKSIYVHRANSKYWQIPILLMALIGLFVLPVYAASFDCGKAATEMEKTICSDPKLSVLDENLAKVYGEIKSQMKGDAEEIAQFTQSQREWLAGLKQKKDGAIACTASKECLTISYQKRIKELQDKLSLVLKKAPSESGDTVLCTSEEKIIFSCAIGKKTLSVCASKDLSSSSGYLQYRFGTSLDKLELVFPQTKDHPRSHFRYIKITSNNESSAQLSFFVGQTEYIVFGESARFDGWNGEGVVVLNAGEVSACLECSRSRGDLAELSDLKATGGIPAIEFESQDIYSKCKKLQAEKDSPPQDANRNKKTRYAFVKGKGIPICEDYYKNLLSFEPREIACTRKFKPELKDFKATDWEKLDLAGNFEVVRKIRKFIQVGDQFAPDTGAYNEKLYKIGLREDERWGRSALHFARLDIDDNGQLENVVLYSGGTCMYSKAYETALLILNADKTIIDLEKTDLVLQNVPEPIPNYPPYSNINYNDIKIKAQNSMGQIYDAFSYKDKVYFDTWNTDYTRVYNIKLYKIEKNKAEKICEYKCVNGCNN